MIRSIFLASALTLGALGAAQAAGPQLVGTGDNAQLVYDAPSRNVVGGGVATLKGADENATVTYQSVVSQPASATPFRAAMPNNSKQG